MATSLETKRALLVAALKKLPPHMREWVAQCKADGLELRKRPDLLWYLLLQSAATSGNSRGWDGLCGNPAVLRSVSYSALSRLPAPEVHERLLAALRTAKVRMQSLKAPQLANNLARIAELGGVEKATRHMLGLPSRREKYKFMIAFEGIGEKYGRNVWMDIYDPDFRSSVAVDKRLKKVAAAMGFAGKGYSQAEAFYCAIAAEAGLEPWELDRLLYKFTDHFIGVVGYVDA